MSNLQKRVLIFVVLAFPAICATIKTWLWIFDLAPEWGEAKGAVAFGLSLISYIAALSTAMGYDVDRRY